jgi:hypothetical protein
MLITGLKKEIIKKCFLNCSFKNNILKKINSYSMKKIIFIFLVSLASVTAQAQLKNTKWKGTIHSDNDIDVVFNYGRDSLKVTNIADSSNVETMTYTIKDKVLTLQKVYGQSDCDTTGSGTYQFEIKDNLLYIKLISDACNDRSSALNNSKWDKIN